MNDENRNLNEYINYRIPQNKSLVNKEIMKYVCGCCCCCSCFCSFLLIIFGFATLEATEFGLNYSWISKSISKYKRKWSLFYRNWPFFHKISKNCSNNRIFNS